MTKYVALLRKAIDNRKNPVAAYRRHIYIRARLAIDMKLLEIGATESVVKQHRAMLEAAIMEIETYFISETIMNELKKSGAIAPLDKSFADGEDELDIEENYNQLNSTDSPQFNVDNTAKTTDMLHTRIRDQMPELPQQKLGVEDNRHSAMLDDGTKSRADEKNELHNPDEKRSLFTVVQNGHASNTDLGKINNKNGDAYPINKVELKTDISTSEDEQQRNIQELQRIARKGKQEPPSEVGLQRSASYHGTDEMLKDDAQPKDDKSFDVEAPSDPKATDEPGGNSERQKEHRIEEINIDNSGAIPNFSSFWDRSRDNAFEKPVENINDTDFLQEKREQPQTLERSVSTDDERHEETGLNREDRDSNPFGETLSTEVGNQEMEQTQFDEDTVPEFLKQEKSMSMNESEKSGDDTFLDMDVDTEPKNEDELGASDVSTDGTLDDYDVNQDSTNSHIPVAWANTNNSPFSNNDLAPPSKVNNSGSNLGIQTVAYVVNVSLVLFFCIVIFVVYRNYYANNTSQLPNNVNNVAFKTNNNANGKVRNTSGANKNALESLDTNTSDRDKQRQITTNELVSQQGQNNSITDDHDRDLSIDNMQDVQKEKLQSTNQDIEIENQLNQQNPVSTKTANTSTDSQVSAASSGSENVPLLSTAMLYDQLPDKKWNKISSNRVDWSILPLSLSNNENHQYVAKLDVLFAAQSLVAGVTIKKNNDKTLAASYIFEIRFKYTGTDRDKTVVDLDHIDLEMKNNSSKQDIIISKFDDNYFGSALIVDEKNQDINDQLIRKFQGINIIFTRSDNEKFFIYIDKGTAGQEAIDKVITG